MIDRILGGVVARCYRECPSVLVSDEHLKLIKEHVDPKMIAKGLVEMGPPFNAEELQLIHENCDEPFEHDFKEGHLWNDDVLNKYAQHIQNYYYNYKNEAQEIDPTIDPNEKHIGPMAQDIEKVNPAAVKETPEGVKTVDTGRLALMNAGAIAELAREIGKLKGGSDKDVPSDIQIKTPAQLPMEYDASKRAVIKATGGCEKLSDERIKDLFKPQYYTPKKRKRSMLGYILGGQ